MDTSENTAMSGLSDLGLGVSIYDQQEFEADVMKQFDEEATRQAAEQQRKFAEKELSSIQREIRQIKTEVTALSKQTTLLLSKPLCDVVHKLKQLKTSQEEKKIKLQELENKEEELRERLSKGDFNDFRPPETDRLFSLPASTTDQADKLELIRTGLLTPFGSSSSISNISATHQEGSHDRHVRKSSSPAVSLADFDWLGITSRTGDKGKGKGKGPIKSKSTDKLSCTDQLKSSSSTPFKNMHLSSNTRTHSSQYENDSAVDLRTESESQPARYGSEDVDYRPGSEASDDSYETDDELGGVVEKRKRKRELISDESDDELIQVNWSKKKKSGKVKRRGSGITDDGDEEVYKTRMRQYKASLSEEEEPPVEFDGGFKISNNIWQKLYRYQQTGVKWLWELHSQQAGGIMGDEMGLGKTIQIIAFLSGLKISNIRSHVTRELGLGPVLIVCPATVLHQWVMEFHTWYPPFRVAILHDTGSYEGSKVSLLNRIVNANGVIVTTYAGLRLSHQLLLRYQWEYVILDEGHKIRNPDSEITLVCKQFSTPHRIILSGSPMQNNLRELWSLFDYVFPGKLGTLPVFMEQFSVPITLGGYINASKIQVETAYRCACILRDTINPYLLRRLKSDVKLQLPNKNEQVLFCRLTDYQRELYEDYIKGPEVEAMMSGGKWIFSGLVTLRKLCNHPDLVTNEYRKGGKGVAGGEGKSVAEGEGEGEDSDDEEFMTLVKKRKVTDDEITGDIEETYGYWRRSGKMIVIEALLRMWYEQKHKVLLFTQSKQMLLIFEKFVQSRDYSYRTMDGSTSIASRQTIIKNFNEDPSIFIFLLTTRVGGIGVNLTGADRVVIYDPDWNPSTDTQARERAWRIGQTRPVTIYRLLTSGTIEEKIYHRQIFKQFLTNRVLRDPRQRRFFKSNDLYELFTLGSSDGHHKTETNAIFAGTGSEVKMPRKDKRKKKSDQVAPSLSHAVSITSGEKDSTTSAVSELSSSVVQEDGCSGSGAIDDTSKEKEKKETSDSIDTTEKELSQEAIEALLSCQKKRKKSKKKKKKRNKHKKRDMEVDGHQITGLESMDIYNPGSEDEEDQITKKQDNIILRALFKKSGVQTAVQHDTIVNSGDPDYTIVESEANKVAQSAVRALKESRRQCQETRGSIQWGQPTWTGQHGTVGAPRFGESSKQTKSVENHFTGTGSQTGGSLNLSSSLLLQKMRSRNALTLPEAGQRHLHSNEQQELLRDLRAFIAHQCRQDGQATTEEILNKFGKRLSPSQSPMFRSMLHEICDFHRYHGDGIWTLKAEYR